MAWKLKVSSNGFCGVDVFDVILMLYKPQVHSPSSLSSILLPTSRLCTQEDVQYLLSGAAQVLLDLDYLSRMKHFHVLDCAAMVC